MEVTEHFNVCRANILLNIPLSRMYFYWSRVIDMDPETLLKCFPINKRRVLFSFPGLSQYLLVRIFEMNSQFAQFAHDLKLYKVK